MSTRVQKGGTVFRPVTKARPRPADNASTQPSVSQVHVSHPPPELHRPSLSAPSDNTPAASVFPSSIMPSQFSPQESIDGPASIANSTKQGVPIVVSSSRVTAPMQIAVSRPTAVPVANEIVGLAGPSRVEVLIVEQTHSESRRSRSESLGTTSAKKSRKTRRPTTPAFDVDADPGEDLDPTSVTMAALCEDTGQGRVSSKAAQILDNHLSWKKSNKEKRARMRTLMEARKYGKKEEVDTARRPEEGSERTSNSDATPGQPFTQLASEHLTVEDTSGQGFDYSQDVATSRYNVQVRIGPNGETIIDEESLFVDRNAEEDTTEYTHVEESDVTKFINSATYSKRFRGSRWSAEETELFYDALSQFGENYELISYVLPGRDRKACKNKFKSEDRKNPQRINYCLTHRKPYDIQTLSRMTGKDFSGPTPEIRAPAALSLAEPQGNSEASRPPASGQTAGPSSTTAEHVEEVVGDIFSFDPE